MATSVLCRGLSSFLPLFFRDQYHVTPINAGYLTALAAFTGSALRPLGGWLSDRLGGARVLSVLLFAIGALYAFESQLPGLGLMVAVLIAMAHGWRFSWLRPNLNLNCLSHEELTLQSEIESLHAWAIHRVSSHVAERKRCGCGNRRST